MCVEVSTLDGAFTRVLEVGHFEDGHLFLLDARPEPVPPDTLVRLTFRNPQDGSEVSARGLIAHVWTAAEAARANIAPGYFVTLDEPMPELQAPEQKPTRPERRIAAPPPRMPPADSRAMAAEKGLVVRAEAGDGGLKVQLSIVVPGHVEAPIEVFVPFPEPVPVASASQLAREEDEPAADDHAVEEGEEEPHSGIELEHNLDHVSWCPPAPPVLKSVPPPEIAAEMDAYCKGPAVPPESAVPGKPLPKRDPSVGAYRRLSLAPDGNADPFLVTKLPKNRR